MRSCGWLTTRERDSRASSVPGAPARKDGRAGTGGNSPGISKGRRGARETRGGAYGTGGNSRTGGNLRTGGKRRTDARDGLGTGRRPKPPLPGGAPSTIPSQPLSRSAAARRRNFAFINNSQPTAPSRTTITSQPTRGPNGQRAPSGGRAGPLLEDVATWTIGASQNTMTKIQAVVVSIRSFCGKGMPVSSRFPGKAGTRSGSGAGGDPRCTEARFIRPRRRDPRPGGRVPGNSHMLWHRAEKVAHILFKCAVIPQTGDAAKARHKVQYLQSPTDDKGGEDSEFPGRARETGIR